jgi:DNA repair protein RadC
MRKIEKHERVPLAIRAEEAFQKAVAEVIADHKRTGDPIAVWRDGKVVHLLPDEIEARESRTDFVAPREKKKKVESAVRSLPDNMESKMDDKPDYMDHRKRLRARFQKDGAEGFHDYELLELLLTYAIPRKDVKPYAKALIRRFKSLGGILDAARKEIEEVEKIGPVSSTLIRLVKEICGEYLAEKMKGREALSSPQAVLDFARMKLSGLPHEAFMVIFLNAKNRVLDYKVLQEGTIDRAVIYPRQVVKEALAHHAAGIIFVHNHPSGDAQPSPEDKNLTRSLMEAARTIDLRVLDHLIVGKEGYCSFVESRLMPGS